MTMRNGPEGCQIRLLREDDQGALAEHLMRLDKSDRRNRFGVALTDGQLANYAHRCKSESDIVLVLKQGVRIHGTCHLAIYCDASSRRVAELGISVDPSLRRAGWAWAMSRRALRIARRRSVTRLVVHYLRSNLAMSALVRRLGPASEEPHGTEVTASLPLFALREKLV